MPFVWLMVAAGGTAAAWIYGEAAGVVVKHYTGNDKLAKGVSNTVLKTIARVYCGPLIDIFKR